MELAPIAGIRVRPAPKVQPKETALSGVFEISLLRPNEDTYSGNNRGKGGQDEEGDEQEELLDEQGYPRLTPRKISSGFRIIA